MINAIKFSIEEIEASDQYFDHTELVFRMIRLSCGLRFASGNECTDLTDRLFLLFS